MEGERSQSKGAVLGTQGNDGAQRRQVSPLTARVKSTRKDVMAKSGLSRSFLLADPRRSHSMKRYC